MHLLLSIAALQLAGLVLPGPDVLLVSQTALSRSRRAALMAGFGVSAGVAVWATAALTGINILFSLFPWLRGLIKVAGGLYLLWMGANLWRASFKRGEAGVTAPPKLPLSDAAALRLGFLTNISNPKVAVFFGSVFSSVMPAHAPTTIKFTALLIMVFLSVAWFSLVALGMSTARLQAAYLDAQKAIDRVAGTLMLGFGGLLLLGKE